MFNSSIRYKNWDTSFTSCKKELNEAALEIEALKSEIEKLEIKSSVKEEEIKKVNTLTNNLNLLLSIVYYGSEEPVGGGRGKTLLLSVCFIRMSFI